MTSAGTTSAALFDRGEQIRLLRGEASFDLLVIGGGATGLGVAVDAAARGFRVALVEASDFAKGTSSRATKLVHGGVRYLAQGNLTLVREALHERATLMANAPHLAQPLSFVVPGYRLWEPAFYGVGLKLYDTLAGSRSLGSTRLLGAAGTLAVLPGVKREGLSGGVQYWDGQFDDARLAVALARTAVSLGAVVVNHAPVVALLHEQGRVKGARVRDAERNDEFELRAACVVNATGVWVDDVIGMAPAEGAQAEGKKPDRSAPPARLVAPSQGVHLVVDREFLPGRHALMVPKTADGRVLFAVPWLGKLILGTTDSPRDDMPAEPQPAEQEIDFILEEAGRYLARAPRRSDVRSAWAGLRPLVKPATGAGSTKQMSREHTVLVGHTGLVTVTGGKWTTYRAMAEDVLTQCMQSKLLPTRAGGVTERLRLVSAPRTRGVSLADAPGVHLYGDDVVTLQALPGAARWLWRDDTGGLNEAMVRFAVRHEMARTVEDVLARRSRLLFLDAAVALRVAGDVAAIVRQERDLGRDETDAAGLAAFTALAQQYGRVAAAAKASS